jgi:hypothetical protein
MLQIPEFTEAHLATLTSRIEKHGDEDVPAITLGLQLMVANTFLDAIDPSIREAAYKRVDGQDDIPGVEPSTPVLRSNSIERLVLPTKYEGWTLDVDDGIDDTDPKTFGSCKCDRFSVEPKQGGSCILRMRIGTSEIDAESSGFLSMRLGQSIWIKLHAPIKAQEDPAGPDEDDLDPENPDAGDGWPFAGSMPPAEPLITAGDIFANPDNPAPNSTVVTMKKSRLKLGTDAEQAQRQAASLAADDAVAGAK